jgi:serine/threonine protein phosphatase PrpC
MPKLGLFTVADGVGGGASGEVASLAAVNGLAGFVRALAAPTLRPHEPDEATEALRAAIECAHECVVDERSNRGTTLVALWLGGAHAVIGAAGDSPAYRWRRGILSALTRRPRPKHETWPGHGDFIRPELRVEKMEPGDLFVLCSDGLSDLVSCEEIAEVLDGAEPLDAQCAELVARAKAAGGFDNVRVVLVGEGRRAARARRHQARNIVFEAPAGEHEPWRLDLSARDQALLEQVGERLCCYSRGSALHHMAIGEPGPMMAPFEGLPVGGPSRASYVPVRWGGLHDSFGGGRDREGWLRHVLDMWSAGVKENRPISA